MVIDVLKHTIVNVCKSVTFDMSKPDKKFFRNIFENMLEYKTTVLSKLWDNNDIQAENISKNYSRNLWKKSFQDLPSKVEKIMIKLIWKIEPDTMFSFDSVDMNKNSAEVMEGIKVVRDWSTRTFWNWFVHHGVSVKWIPLFFDREKIKEDKKEQVRFDIFTKQIDKIISIYWSWYWILADRLYDDYKKFNLLLEKKFNFAIRLKTNRKVIILDWDLAWQKIPVWELLEWRYRVNFNWLKQDLFIYVKTIKWQDKPIRVISNVDDEKVVEKYLKRWEIERIFKSGKQEFNFEKIWTKKLQKTDNLVAMVQLCLWVSAYMYNKIEPVYEFGQEKKTISLVQFSKNLKKFLIQVSKTFNRNSIICFIAKYMKKIKKMKFNLKKVTLKPDITWQLSLELVY